MTPHPYRVAYEQAAGELTEIKGRFEQLLLRKSQLDNVIAAFKPLFENVGGSNLDESGLEVPQEHAEPSGYSFGEVPSPLPELGEAGGDPFQPRGRSGYRFRGLGQELKGIQRNV
jgi:hypothetical protein